MNPIKPWRILTSRRLNDYRIFETHTDRVVSPRTGKEHDVYLIRGGSWVNVLALTPQREILLVQQYRHGAREIMWEIPGGVINSGETPEAAAARELLEETGYAGSSPRVLGKVHPNPAYQTNLCYTVLIENIAFRQQAQMDEMEDIAVQLVPEEEFGRMVAQGKITHALVMVADHWLRLWRSGAI